MRMVVSLVVALLLSMPAFAQDRPSPWQDVITQQVEALRAGDGKAALSHAGAGFQAIYDDPSDFFSDIVKSGYGPIVLSRSHSFGSFSEQGSDTVLQDVRFFEADDSLYEAVYHMVKEDGRGWTVHGVVMRKAAGLGV